MKVNERVNPKSSHHKKKNCFCFLKKISELEDKPTETMGTEGQREKG